EPAGFSGARGFLVAALAAARQPPRAIAAKRDRSLVQGAHRMSTWVLLRGLTRETRHWGRLPDALREATGGGPHLLLLDLPGNGEFAQLHAPSTVAAMVEFVRAAARQRGAAGPLNILAMSPGGMVAT